MRRKVARDKLESLFGINPNQDNAEIDNAIRKQVETTRGQQAGYLDGTSGAAGQEFTKMCSEDKSAGIRYKYEGRQNDTYQEPSLDKREIAALDLLVGRLDKANPPAVYMKAGLIWKKM